MAGFDQFLGGSANDAGAATIVLTTGATVAAGSRIVLGVAGGNGAGSTLSSVTGGGLTWTIDKSGAPAFFNIYLVSAPAPVGLASGTAITANYSGITSGRAILGLSLTGAPIVGTVPALTTGAVAAWATASASVSAGSALVAFAINQDNGSSGNTITAPSVEDGEVNAGAATYDAVLAHRLEATAGSVTVAGTWATAVSWGAIVAEYKDPPASIWVPHRMPLGV
jgi:hypothetical protein